jgi:hypothetical protein
MRFHDERDRRLHPMRYSKIDEPTPGNDRFVVRRRGTSARVPLSRPSRPEFVSHDDGIADESLMVTVCYEAHLSMQQMLEVFAEMRGDDL